MTDNKPGDPFPTIDIPTPYGLVAVVCQHIAPGIAVTPYLDRSGDEPCFGGAFTITHTTTGRVFAQGQACIECAVTAARRLAALDLDWTKANISSAESMVAFLGNDREAVGKALHDFGKCVQQICALGDDGQLEECGSCGFTGSHAPYCIEGGIADGRREQRSHPRKRGQ